MCKHERTFRKDTELSGGEIYQAIKCVDCGRELGHTMFCSWLNNPPFYWVKIMVRPELIEDGAILFCPEIEAKCGYLFNTKDGKLYCFWHDKEIHDRLLDPKFLNKMTKRDPL